MYRPALYMAELGFGLSVYMVQGTRGTHTQTHRAFILYLASSMYHHQHHYVLELNNSNGVAR